MTNFFGVVICEDEYALKKMEIGGDIRVILQFIMTFGRELVVMLTKPSMFGKL